MVTTPLPSIYTGFHNLGVLPHQLSPPSRSACWKNTGQVFRISILAIQLETRKLRDLKGLPEAPSLASKE